MSLLNSEELLDHLQDAVERNTGHRGFNCPICQGGEWTIVDGVMSQELRGDETTTVHTAPIVCDNCGFMARFAIGQE